MIALESSLPAMLPRSLCLRCLRPASVCYCIHLTPIASATRVVFLQHPRESRVAIGTCRMAHIALTGSELYRGVSFEEHARVRALAADASGAVAVLYPGDDARDPEALDAGPPRTLIVLDGTWHQAQTMWRANPSLHRLPRIGFMPAAPGNYRIRREPAPNCLATIEAVVEVLGRLEGDARRFQPMLRAFEHMVETELVYRTLRPGTSWRHSKRRRQPRPSAARVSLRARRADLVVVYAEANAHPIRRGAADALERGRRRSDVPELVQLVARRLATGEHFHAIIAPRRALVPSTPYHLELDAERLLAGEEVATALARWRAFVRPADLLCAWGYYTTTLLWGAGDQQRAPFDVRDAMTRELGRRTGGVEEAAALFGDPAPGADDTPDTPLRPWTDGRAGRRIAALETIVARLAE